MPSPASTERIGHRGAPLDCLENTMASFRRAVELGADAVELDVHVTRDGVPVVHHDPALGPKVFPSAFARKALADMSADEVGSIRLSTGDGIPSLREALEELTPRTRVYVEIKRGSVLATVNVVAAFRESVAVHSFDHDAIEQVARIAPDLNRGVLIDQRSDDIVQIVKRTRARDVWPAWKLVDKSLIELSRSLGFRVIPWTVNKTSACRRLIELGVAGICTNDLPALERALS